MSEILDDDFQPLHQLKKRHGCVTAWLILLIIVNSMAALSNLFARGLISELMPGTGDSPYLIILGFLAIINVLFSIMLFQWKKIGFYGFIITSLIAFIINLIMGIGVAQSALGLIGIAILYGILQIQEDGQSAWSHLE